MPLSSKPNRVAYLSGIRGVNVQQGITELVLPKRSFLGNPTIHENGFPTAFVLHSSQFVALHPWDTRAHYDEQHITHQFLLSNVDILFISRSTTQIRDTWITHFSNTLQDLQITPDIVSILTALLQHPIPKPD